MIYTISTYITVFVLTEKVAFNIASEASYVYIFNGQKVNQKCPKWLIWRVLEK